MWFSRWPEVPDGSSPHPPPEVGITAHVPLVRRPVGVAGSADHVARGHDGVRGPGPTPGALPMDDDAHTFVSPCLIQHRTSVVAPQLDKEEL